MAHVERHLSGIHGLGAFAARPLPAQAVFGLYEGQRYSPQELEAKEWDQQLTYLFSLSSEEMIDGAEGGNETRHLNHACSPNCEAFEAQDENGRLVLKFHEARSRPGRGRSVSALCVCSKPEAPIRDLRRLSFAHNAPLLVPCHPCGF